MLAQHFVLGGLPDLKGHFSSLLKKLLFFGRTLLLQLWGAWDARSEAAWRAARAVGTYVDAGKLTPGLANLCWCRNGGSRASKPVLAQHFVLGVFAGP